MLFLKWSYLVFCETTVVFRTEAGKESERIMRRTVVLFAQREMTKITEHWALA